MIEFLPPDKLNTSTLENELNDNGLIIDDGDVVLADGMLRINNVTEEDRDQVQQIIDNHTPPSPPPDGNRLKLAVFSDEGLGRKKARELVGKYPDLLDAVNNGNWLMVREAIDDAKAENVLNDTQYQTITTILDSHNVP